MPYTTYLDGKLNQQMFGSTAYTIPATVYVGLSITTPGKDATGVTEPSGGAYARVSMTNNTTNFQASAVQPATGQQQENKTVITFPDATADWGTVRYHLIYDASTSGNLLAYGVLDSPKAVIDGDSVKFNASALKIVLD